jgi:hypothetical protein
MSQEDAIYKIILRADYKFIEALYLDEDLYFINFLDKNAKPILLNTYEQDLTIYGYVNHVDWVAQGNDPLYPDENSIIDDF